MNISAYLGVAGLSDVGYRFYTTTESAVAARVTTGITDAGDGWYSAEVTLPATAASVRWDSTGTTAAFGREYFDFDSVLTRVSGVEGGVTLQQALRYILSFCAGKSSGAGTGTIIFKAPDGSTDRVTLTVNTTTGERSATTLNG